jgi:hypothetical protein
MDIPRLRKLALKVFDESNDVFNGSNYHIYLHIDKNNEQIYY